MQTVYHIPALLTETLEGLNLRANGVYVDVTFGGGGHSRAILSHLNKDGRLYSFDQDLDALHNAQSDATLVNNPSWHFVHGNFRYLSNFLDFEGVQPGSVDGILADLGVSFHHFDEAERGFSFRFAGPLDMRMNQTGGRTAADILNSYSEEELARVLYLYGELKNSRQLAARIARRRAEAPFARTEDLVHLLTGGKFTMHNGEMEIDPFLKKDLPRIFQALRIEVNDEMSALREMLLAGADMLRPGGRFVILTYHSLEDRMVKNFFKTGNLDGKQEKDFYGNLITPFDAKTSGKVIVASDEEVSRNPRSRSAKLRIATKL